MSRYKPPNLPNGTSYKVPDWAGKPPAGLHLDVMKDGKMIQKLMIDEKNCYLFGRNQQMCDFPIDHQSCSRVHGALVWHKDLHRPFLIDCGSVHGTFVGSIRLEIGKPQQIPIDSKLHFGASTRMYVIRERISKISNGLSLADESTFVSSLPEDETELDNLTEFNTAQNRRNTSVMNMQESASTRTSAARKGGALYVHFSDQEDVINPEDVDPSIGRFRNLVQETFIPNKRVRLNLPPVGVSSYHLVSEPGPQSPPLQQQQPTPHIPALNPAYAAASKLGLPMPNLAADILDEPRQLPGPVPTRLFTSPNPTPPSKHRSVAPLPLTSATSAAATKVQDDSEPHKKKYAKEAWPGKKPIGFGAISL